MGWVVGGEKGHFIERILVENIVSREREGEKVKGLTARKRERGIIERVRW